MSTAQKQLVLAKLNGELPGSKPSCCCHDPQAAQCDIDSTDSRPKAANQLCEKNVPGVRIVRLEDAAKCRGISWLWSIFSEVVVEETDHLIIASEPRLLFWLAIENDRAIARACCPDPPVP